MYTLDLDDYHKMTNTDSCYLDGRYFYKVFANYPGTIPEPLKIFISERPNQKSVAVDMKASNIDTSVPGLLRVVIQTPKSRHSNLVILDYENKKAYRFEPLGPNAPYFDEITKTIQSYLSFFLDVDVEILDVEVDEEANLDEKNPQCLVSGFCTAYNIMLAYSWLKGEEPDFTEIRKFAKKIQTEYGTLPMEGAEIEYGLFDEKGPDPGKMALGGVVGLGAGALIGGGAGAAIGGLGGLAIGSLF